MLEKTADFATAQAFAKAILDRKERMGELIVQLRSEDMLGLECNETVELEKLAGLQAKAAVELAEWFTTMLVEQSDVIQQGGSPEDGEHV